MPEMDRLWCALRDTQERVTELETRLSLLEDEEDVALEDWDDDEEDEDDLEDWEYGDFQYGVDWYDDDGKAQQARQEEEDEPES